MNIVQRIESYWDNRSQKFSQDRMIEVNGIDGDSWQRLIESHLPHKSNLKVLDVGTGAGAFAIILSRLGHKVIGIDLSSKMLNEAKKNILHHKCNVELFKMNAQQLTFDNEYFDLVITRNLTWTLPDVMTAYREWYRVLKVNGTLINFDSDYGDKNFLNGKTCAKAEVENQMLIECNDIKNNLRISTHRRPNWDIKFLKHLGFDVNFDLDISSIVHQDSNCSYDSVPLFGIYAKKLPIL